MKRNNKGYWVGEDGRYNVRILENGRRKYLGAYNSESEALDVYAKACREKLIRCVNSYNHCIDDGVVYKDNYIVFDNGDIFSITGRKIRPSLNTHGYLFCHINDDLEVIHRIIAKCFIRNIHNKPHVNHINGIKTDNRVANLEWCTASENIKHAYDTGLKTGPCGEINGRSKLSASDVQYIRDHYIPRDDEYGMHALAEKFNVHRNTIYDIVHNLHWAY